MSHLIKITHWRRTRLSFFLLALLLTACEDQAVNEETAKLIEEFMEFDLPVESPQATEQSTTPQQPTQQSAINGTGDLVANDDFLFESNYKIIVSVDVSSNFQYLTVCYPDAEAGPDYSNCLLKAELIDGYLYRELLLTNDTSRLVASAWDFSDPENPLMQSWNRGGDGDIILLSN